jgi:hypothetical protein
MRTILQRAADRSRKSNEKGRSANVRQNMRTILQRAADRNRKSNEISVLSTFLVLTVVNTMRSVSVAFDELCNEVVDSLSVITRPYIQRVTLPSRHNTNATTSYCTYQST